MKGALLLFSLLTGAQSFVVSPKAAVSGTRLEALIPEDQMSPEQLEILAIQRKWSEIRHLDRDEAQKTLDGEWLEAYNRFYEKYDDDMTRMTEIVQKLESYIDPPKIKKKTKGQKKRDAYAKKLEREAARAASK